MQAARQNAVALYPGERNAYNGTTSHASKVMPEALSEESAYLIARKKAHEVGQLSVFDV